MAQRSKKRKARAALALDLGRAGLASWREMFSRCAIPLLLALITFGVFLPSLKSGFVYDARFEIMSEGFVTSLANLPAVLSLKVLGMNLLLAGRPGQLLFLMLNAALWGREPWGYHLASNLLHASNAALLFVLLRRLVVAEIGVVVGGAVRRIQLALLAVTLIFALHPITVEPVAAINYSSDLLVTFFTLLALLAATVFRPENRRLALLAGVTGTLCAFAAVTCKESGAATAPLLIVYWFLFRRDEKRVPWLLFLGAAMTVTLAFLFARFHFALPSTDTPSYLGGSFATLLQTQPRLWVFMMGKVVWPAHFSADYTLTNLGGLTTTLALPVLLAVALAQAWLALKSRLGALGVCIFWAGLVTVSNFMPLYRILGDRFYYLPLAGVAMQMLALLLMTRNAQRGFWLALAPLVIAVVPFTFLTIQRQAVFADDYALWSDTVLASPASPTAHNDLGLALYARGDADAAQREWQKALAIAPDGSDTHNNLSRALCSTHNDLGIVVFHEGKIDEAIAQYQQAIEIKPDFAEAHYDLGNAFLQKGETDAAIAEYQKALAIQPNIEEAETNLGTALWQSGKTGEAITHYRKAIAIDPQNADARGNLAKAQAQLSAPIDAMARFQALLRDAAAKAPKASQP